MNSSEHPSWGTIIHIMCIFRGWNSEYVDKQYFLVEGSTKFPPIFSLLYSLHSIHLLHRSNVLWGRWVSTLSSARKIFTVHYVGWCRICLLFLALGLLTGQWYPHPRRSSIWCPPLLGIHRCFPRQIPRETLRTRSERILVFPLACSRMLIVGQRSPGWLGRQPLGAGMCIVGFGSPREGLQRRDRRWEGGKERCGGRERRALCTSNVGECKRKSITHSRRMDFWFYMLCQGDKKCVRACLASYVSNWLLFPMFKRYYVS